MEIKVNGLPVNLPEGKNGLQDVFAAIGIAFEQTGIAVAINLELVPRSAWPTTLVQSGDSIEVITARQGG
ncbi:MAG TPA: sulfur carrier protein ThiS [Bacteroidia bacterium]|nr:sulfur carrier protein ThiS [Bacteroidia bacterium]